MSYSLNSLKEGYIGDYCLGFGVWVQGLGFGLQSLGVYDLDLALGFDRE